MIVSNHKTQQLETRLFELKVTSHTIDIEHFYTNIDRVPVYHFSYRTPRNIQYIWIALKSSCSEGKERKVKERRPKNSISQLGYRSI